MTIKGSSIEWFKNFNNNFCVIIRNCLLDNQGNPYLMHPSVVRGVSNCLQSFSECSLANITRALGSVGSCLLSGSTSTCGNGIVEPWEECDCGETDEDCSETCCYPASHTGRGCQLRPGAACSPSEGPCCSLQCSYITPSGQSEARCLEASECHGDSYCDGQRSLCPEPRSKREGIPCQDGAKVSFSNPPSK